MKNKVVRICLWVLGGFTVLVLCTAWYLNVHWGRMLRNELQGYVTDLSDSLYVLHFKDVRLNVLTGSVIVEDAHMTLDSAVYRKMLAAHKAPSTIYLISVEKLHLKYFRPWRYFRNQELRAGSLTVTGPDIFMEQNATVLDTTKPRTAYENISAKMKSIFIGKLIMDETNFKYVFIRKDTTTATHQFLHLRVRVNDFLIDSAALNDPTRFLYARNYDIGMRDYAHLSKDSLYNMLLRGISYDAAEQTLHISQFEVQPRYSRDSFGIKLGKQQDLYNLTLHNISVNHLNPKLLLQNQECWAKRVDINSGELSIYHDRRLPLPPGDKLGQYPNQLLQQLQAPISIDTLIARRMDIKYEETSPESDQTGEIRFSNAHSTFYNITNIDSLVANNNHCTADMDAIFMESGKLRAHFDFTLNSAGGAFSISAQLNGMNGKELNPVTMPLGKVEVRSCDIEDLSFNIKGDEKKAAGTVKLLYKNLRIAILKQDKAHKEFVRKGLVSLLANLMVIKDSNPLPGEKPRVARPTLARDPKKSFFNLVWKTLFEGVKETAGASRI
ncbi:hypothetical protein [Chitinophaga vietnamensis]|uniref:hypothetical protein n=1 Tax=Chitinophaga vietnamensis TaxID=2593957 RepID=UPI0011788EF4|nr:hypothetical protein [Chitinophaga vietnamensis]